MDGLAQERGVRDLVPIRGVRRSFPEVERDDASVPPLWERQVRKRHDVVVGLDDAATSVVDNPVISGAIPVASPKRGNITI